MELGIATGVLTALGLASAVVGLLVPDTGPLAAAAAVGGLMIMVLALGAWLGSAGAHRALVVTVLLLAVALLVLRAPWAALTMVAGGALAVAPPRVRAWYRQTV